MNDPIIDVPELLERVQDDKELMLELFDIFMEDFPGKRQQLGEAIKEKNFENIRGVAHSVKGASGNISAKLVREVCMKLEMMGKNNTLDGAEAVLVQLDEEYAKLTEQMQLVRKEYGPA
ncbi:MAG: Hpt domain-containing protein [Candidatus Omnitrophica bacterium]|nr:Hpt domain-containing protein [Candidatus Omnitrophota bacterium]